jgi:hypothetical protein
MFGTSIRLPSAGASKWVRERYPQCRAALCEIPAETRRSQPSRLVSPQRGFTVSPTKTRNLGSPELRRARASPCVYQAGRPLRSRTLLRRVSTAGSRMRCSSAWWKTRTPTSSPSAKPKVSRGTVPCTHSCFLPLSIFCPLMTETSPDKLTCRSCGRQSPLGHLRPAHPRPETQRVQKQLQYPRGSHHPQPPSRRGLPRSHQELSHGLR